MSRALLLGGLLLLIVLPVFAIAATHVVNQSGFTFVPEELTVEVGDTVEWHWFNGNHTVTSGIDNDDPDAGHLFDVLFDNTNPVVSFTFDTVGSVDYFSRPFVDVGMRGVIHVDASVPTEGSSWGYVKALY